jgi:MFS family permease
MIGLTKSLFYLLEFLHCYGVVFYSNFIFFYMNRQFGFGAKENLLLAALHGTVYTIASWQGGAFAQRHGYVKSLYIGCIGMSLMMVAGLFAHGATTQVVIFGVWSVFLCFTWPSLEAIISSSAGNSLCTLVGLYNVTWAAGGALAYFTAGMVLDKLGMPSLFWLPLCFFLVELAILPYAALRFAKESKSLPVTPQQHPRVDPATSKKFLYMAWLANPLSYVAINTVIPLIPTIAGKLGLSTGLAGIFGSLWMFTRLFAFIALWRWTGWHYRLRWLIASYAIMIIGFVGMILTQSIAVLIICELGFGVAVGLIYYSSLYYSMNASDQQGANGGLHEAMIGMGLGLGPALGAAALFLLPAASGAGAWSVGGFLVAGFGGLLWMGRFRKANTALAMQR